MMPITDEFIRFTEFARSYITEDFMLYFGLLAVVPGLLFMIALFFSILRIKYAITRDGKEAPALHFLNLTLYFAVIVNSHKSSEKALKKEQTQGLTERSVVLVTTMLVYPYVRPIDRFIARAWVFFGILLGVCVVLFYWLYKE